MHLSKKLELDKENDQVVNCIKTSQLINYE